MKHFNPVSNTTARYLYNSSSWPNQGSIAISVEGVIPLSGRYDTESAKPNISKHIHLKLF